MNQPTHAWLAVEAYRKIDALSSTPEGKEKKLDGLARLLGANLRDVVQLTGIKPKGAMPIAKQLLFSPMDIAMTRWMTRRPK